jgi:uncharacterized protein (TIGR00255 family)
MTHAPPAALASMTGFGRGAGTAAGRPFAWELRSVNARGLDIRLRLPSGFDAEEPDFRQRIGAVLKRGSVQAQLGWGAGTQGAVTVRAAVLDHMLMLATDLAARIPGAQPPRAEALLALPGVLAAGAEADPALAPADRQSVAAGLDHALAELSRSRAAEGARLGAVLAERVDTIAQLVAAARTAAAGQPQAQQERLLETLRALLGAESAPDPARVAQEVALLASRADVREELDRLDSHVTEARRLLDEGMAVGRRLDFLTQEFMREANTLCSKSATAALTAVGLRLKATIEQVREQVQNVE